MSGRPISIISAGKSGTDGSVPFQNAGVNQTSPRAEVVGIFTNNLRFYIRVLPMELGTVPTALIAGAFVAFFCRSKSCASAGSGPG